MKNKKSFFKGALTGALAVLLIMSMVSCGIKLPGTSKTSKKSSSTSNSEELLDDSTKTKLELLEQLVDESYSGDIDMDDLQEGLYRGYIDGLGDKYSVYYDEDETKAAVEFMVAACKDGGLTWAGSGQIPANTEVTGNEEYAALPYRSNYQDEVEKAVLPAKNPHFYAMKDGMIQSLDTIWTGTNDAATGIDALVDELSSNLE